MVIRWWMMSTNFVSRYCPQITPQGLRLHSVACELKPLSSFDLRDNKTLQQIWSVSINSRKLSRRVDFKSHCHFASRRHQPESALNGNESEGITVTKSLKTFLDMWSKEVGKQSSELRITFTSWRVVWDCPSHNNTLNERVAWDVTSHNNTLNEGWCETWKHITIHSMKGGVRLWCETWHQVWSVWSAKCGV